MYCALTYDVVQCSLALYFTADFYFLTKIDFQNENLITRIGKLEEHIDENLSIVASVPDLITIVDNDTGEPIPTEDICYGQRVAVITLPSHPLLRTPQALNVVGPQAFGYNDIRFNPCGPFKHMPPVGPT